LTALRRRKIASEYFAGARFAESEAMWRGLAAEGFHPPELAALLGDGFINRALLGLDFATMRLVLQGQGWG